MKIQSNDDLLICWWCWCCGSFSYTHTFTYTSCFSRCQLDFITSKFTHHQNDEYKRSLNVNKNSRETETETESDAESENTKFFLSLIVLQMKMLTCSVKMFCEVPGYSKSEVNNANAYRAARVGWWWCLYCSVLFCQWL